MEKLQGRFPRAILPSVDLTSEAQEFTDLVQGSMTVEQYATKFIQLSQFSFYLVSTEKLKARKFERGLNPRVMNQVMGFKIGNLMDLISKASVIEQMQKTNSEYFNQKKRSAPQGNRYGGQP